MSGTSPAAEDSLTPVPQGLRVMRALGMVALALSALGDLLIISVTVDGEGGSWAPLASLATCLGAVLWPARGRPRWLTPTARVTGSAVMSLAVTVGVRVTGGTGGFGPAEAFGLLCLVLIAVRTCPPAALPAAALLAGAAALALPFRTRTDSSGQAGQLGVTIAIVVLIAVFAGLGGYLRSQDQRRRTAQARARQAERLAMAAELHDFVAHHVTGILVQAQMAHLLTEAQPERVGPILAGIERAASEALASMRRTVGLLRTDPDADATRTPGAGPDGHQPIGDLSALPELLTRHDHSHDGVGPALSYRRDPTVPGNLPHEVQAAAFRVVQEALTNIRKHAADATEVEITLHHDEVGLHITVRDDGTIPAPLPDLARGGGFGLTGLTERVTTLNGHLHAGPRPDRGWEVLATIPTPAPRPAHHPETPPPLSDGSQDRGQARGT